MKKGQVVVDLRDRRVGRLVVGQFIGGLGSKWHCRCDCGTEIDVAGGNLRRGISKSCGCLKREGGAAKVRSYSHGESKRAGSPPTAEYNIWGGMIQRCHNPKNAAWAYYGGRGVQVCPRWRKRFQAFLADMGRRPTPRHSIDRYPNPDGNYEPRNARWATPLQQRHNRSEALR